MDCHQQRENLSATFIHAFNSMKKEIRLENQTRYVNFSNCLSQATYEYKYRVEGPGGIDEKIQTSAQHIHAAQLAIASLEPRLHDVEHASRRVTQYIKELNDTCDLGDNVTEHLKEV